MSNNTNKNQNRTALEDMFLYRIEIANGVVDFYAYPIFDQDCSLRHNIDSKNAVHKTLRYSYYGDDRRFGDDDAERDTTIVDVALLEDNIVTDFGFCSPSLDDTAEYTIEELGRELKAAGKI